MEMMIMMLMMMLMMMARLIETNGRQYLHTGAAMT
jgi:hypothetical protein